MRPFRQIAKHTLNRVLGVAGLEVRRTPAFSMESVLSALIGNSGVNLVLDVGANRGQFARCLREIGYSGEIVSFEPGKEEHRDLVEIAGKDAKWTVAPRMAIGSKVGEVDFHIAQNSVSSSVLHVGMEHIQADSGATQVRTERVAMMPLSEAASPWVNESSVVFVKLDVQGYEHEVLAGFGLLLSRVAVIELEMSVEPLYDGSRDMFQQFVDLNLLGFDLHYLEAGFGNVASRKVLQYEGVFSKKVIKG
jgi:FkbM family methyltransferase